MASEPIPLEKAIALFVKFMQCGDEAEIDQVHNFISKVNDNDSKGKPCSQRKSNSPKTPMQSRITKKRGTGARAIRPLNSYMAFRAYYAPLFAEFPQKLVSGFITALWRTDPFKAKWSIIAKAYSEIRDAQGRENTPLNLFLDIAAIGLYIIAPNEYLFQLGWEARTENSDYHLARIRVPDLSSFDSRILSTIMSVPELIECCRSYGYPVAQSQPTMKTSFDQGPIMVMTAQVHNNNTNISDPAVVSSTNDGQDFKARSPIDVSLGFTNGSATSFEHRENSNHVASKDPKAAIDIEAETDKISSLLCCRLDNEENDGDRDNSEKRDANTCEDLLKESDDTYPYHKQFDPYGPHMNDLLYDPFDPLNPFFGNYTSGNTNDLSDWFTDL